MINIERITAIAMSLQSLLVIAAPGTVKAQENALYEGYCNISHKDPEEAQKCKMAVCIKLAVGQYDDGVTQANEIGKVIVKRACDRHTQPIADTIGRRFHIAPSRAIEIVITSFSEQATEAVLTSRVAANAAKRSGPADTSKPQ